MWPTITYVSLSDQTYQHLNFFGCCCFSNPTLEICCFVQLCYSLSIQPERHIMGMTAYLFTYQFGLWCHLYHHSHDHQSWCIIVYLNPNNSFITFFKNLLKKLSPKNPKKKPSGDGSFIIIITKAIQKYIGP